MALEPENTTPRDTENPIQHILDNGRTVMALASEWGLTPDGVYRLKRFEYVPRPSTAQRMGETFGWSAGEVVDFWLGRVSSKSEAAQ